MSGSSQVERTSTYYHLLTESACMNFILNPADPGYETRWHREWTEEAERWIQRVQPILEQKFAMLAAQPDPDWPLVRYDESFPLWNSYRDPESPPPWRVGFVGLKGTGMTQLTVAFSRMPGEAARERFKRELAKDFAMLDPKEGAL